MPEVWLQVQPDRILQGEDSLGSIADVGEHLTPPEMGLGILRLERDRFVKVDDRAAVVIVVVMSKRTVIVGICVVGLELVF